MLIRWASKRWLIMKVFSTSLHFANSTLDSMKSMSMFVALYFQFLDDLARIKSVTEDNLDDYWLLIGQFMISNVFHGNVFG
jgi:phage terminase large subunit